MNAIKKSIIFLIIFVLTITTSSQLVAEYTNENLILNKERSFELYEKLINDFWDREENLSLNYYPKNPNSVYYTYLWPYIQMMAMNSRMFELFPDSIKIKNFQRILADSLEKYKSSRSDYLVYDSYPPIHGGGDSFYDDNIWVAMELLKTYKILGDEKYLTKAMQVTDYVYSGWDENTGGIYWKEIDWETKNTCVNAPAIIASIKIFNETSAQKYLSEAIKIYEWTKTNLMDKRNGTYYDSIHDNGKIDYTKWTYNTGMMISSGILLFEIIGDEKYLEDAKKSAEGAFNHFTSKRTVNGEIIPFYPEMPWFNLLLLQGYIDLYKYTEDSKYLISFNNMMNYAWENSRDQRNYVSPDWGLRSGIKNQDYVYSLDQASTTEVYALLALTNFEFKEVPSSSTSESFEESNESSKNSNSSEEVVSSQYSISSEEIILSETQMPSEIESSSENQISIEDSLPSTENSVIDEKASNDSKTQSRDKNVTIFIILLLVVTLGTTIYILIKRNIITIRGINSIK